MYVGAQIGTWELFHSVAFRTRRINMKKWAGYLPHRHVGRIWRRALAVHQRSCIMSSPRQVDVAAYSVINILLVGVGVIFPDWIGLWAIFLTSFFMSVMFPTIFALGIDGLGRNTKIGGSLIVMSMVGGAILTPLMGWTLACDSPHLHRLHGSAWMLLRCGPLLGSLAAS